MSFDHELENFLTCMLMSHISFANKFMIGKCDTFKLCKVVELQKYSFDDIYKYFIGPYCSTPSRTISAIIMYLIMTLPHAPAKAMMGMKPELPEWSKGWVCLQGNIQTIFTENG